MTPESPEVRALIESGLGYLEKETDDRLGGKCLIALAFLKDGVALDHPRIVEAVEACRSTTAQQIQSDSVYSNGLAVIFLAELDPSRYRDLISRFAGALEQRQKDHGGWGYSAYSTGDTSQTQYAALSFWELMQAGMAPSVETVEQCTNWLIRTQDPEGVWGYQGVDPGNYERTKQTKTSLSMSAAGMGSTLILGNVLGLTLEPASARNQEAQESPLPSALKVADAADRKVVPKLNSTGVDRTQFQETISLGQQWWEKNYDPQEIRRWTYPCYLLYSIERYKSFEEYLEGVAPEEPQWYQDGYEYLKEHQQPDDSWRGHSGEPSATAFAVLFLLRSTQKSIKASLGQGTLVGGRGLSADLSRMKMRNGRLVVEQKPTEIDKLLNMLEGGNNPELEALLNSPTELLVGEVGPEEARRLQQLVKSGEAESRLMAVRALSKMRSLDYVPTLLYAFTDPDKRVVRAARDGLRFVSRRFEGFGLPDNFTEDERYNALDKWKDWYRRVRPDAPPLP